jgi:hypothetical protein
LRIHWSDEYQDAALLCTPADNYRSDTARAHSIWNSSIRPDPTNKAKPLDDYTAVLTRPTLVIAMGTHTLSSALPKLLLTWSITQRSKSRI